MKTAVDLFLDSGAFSAWNQGIEIDLDEYIAFVKEHEDIIEIYANLDAIGDPEKTWKNQRAMEKAGLHPLPCFHYGEPIKYLKRYIDRYDYIALGGMVPISTRNLSVWLDSLFSDWLTDEGGIPIVKVHGFGLSSLPLMLRYPWYSVDSTSWVLTGRMGSIFVPRWRKGGWIYDEQSWKVAVSTRSPTKKDAGKHISTFSRGERAMIVRYIEEKGFCLGESEFRMESSDYELAENESWNGKASKGKREVETILERGISNDYKLRDQINVAYFLDLEKSLPEWPWQWKTPRRIEMGASTYEDLFRNANNHLRWTRCIPLGGEGTTPVAPPHLSKQRCSTSIREDRITSQEESRMKIYLAIAAVGGIDVRKHLMERGARVLLSFHYDKRTMKKIEARRRKR